MFLHPLDTCHVQQISDLIQNVADLFLWFVNVKCWVVLTCKLNIKLVNLNTNHVEAIKWKHFLRYWPFLRGIYRSPVNSLHKGPVTRSFDIFFDLCLNKWLSKQSWGWWFEMPSCSLWCHFNDEIYLNWNKAKFCPQNIFISSLLIITI